MRRGLRTAREGVVVSIASDGTVTCLMYDEYIAGTRNIERTDQFDRRRLKVIP